MRSRARAFSLVEAVLAGFLMLTAVTIAIWVFDASLRAQAVQEVRLLAVQVAQNKLEEIRGYADSQFGGGLTLFDGVQTQVGPGLEMRTRATLQTIYSPCSQLETQYPATA